MSDEREETRPLRLPAKELLAVKLPPLATQLKHVPWTLEAFFFFCNLYEKTPECNNESKNGRSQSNLTLELFKSSMVFELNQYPTAERTKLVDQ